MFKITLPKDVRKDYFGNPINSGNTCSLQNETNDDLRGFKLSYLFNLKGLG